MIRVALEVVLAVVTFLPVPAVLFYALAAQRPPKALTDPVTPLSVGLVDSLYGLADVFVWRPDRALAVAGLFGHWRHLPHPASAA